MFEDGATASGFFTLNTEGNPSQRSDLLDAIAITTRRGISSIRGGPLFEGTQYTCQTDRSYTCERFHSNGASGDATRERVQIDSDNHFLSLVFLHPLPDTGGTVSLAIFPPTNTDGWSREVNPVLPQFNQYYRMVVSGEVTTAIPELSHGLFVSLGLAALVGLTTRRKSTAH